MMRLHNTLTRQTEEFKPIEPGEVGLYTCGPTVYDHVHLGNYRTYIFEDSLRRSLRAQGFSIKHVMNITDIDDKTIKRSRERYPDSEPREALARLTAHYEKIFLAGAKELGIDFSDSEIVRATDHIADMQQLIREIPNKYAADDGVYYDLTKDPDYGVLVKLERGHEQHRINNDEYDKEHAADFALWRAAVENEPAWSFELDGQDIAGRPGWHIECSAMSTKFLGQPFDIHTGGVDLIFPHHENEIAQSRAAKGKSLANYFVHAEHLLVEGQKMSKSAANFFTLDDIAGHGIEPLAFRLLTLQSHYRSQLDFSWESLAAAQANLKSLQAWADQARQEVKQLSPDQVSTLLAAIKDSLANDLNTAAALAELNKATELGAPTESLLNELDELLGLSLAGRKDITSEQKDLISQREAARQASDWQNADSLRSQLLLQGIAIDDTADGPVWSRT